MATFGYAQPEHDIRIAVFAWPSCECVVSIPWEKKPNGEVGRALWAIPYPGGPNGATASRHVPTDQRPDVFDWRELETRATTRGPEVEEAVDEPERGRTLHRQYHHRRGRAPSPDVLLTANSPPARGQILHRNFRSLARNISQTEGAQWASRTQDEGSLIIACCDQTVKFFEVWAGKSKNPSARRNESVKRKIELSGIERALGSKEGVFGGSKVLEGWCEDGKDIGAGVDEVNGNADVIR